MTGPTNIKEFRSIIESAFQSLGFQKHRLASRKIDVWTLSGGDLVRFYFPGAHRRPWGFVMSGGIGVEIPSLREWLTANKASNELGMFHTHFVGYHIANDSWSHSFSIEHGEVVPADLWVARIRKRLEEIPPTIHDLLKLFDHDPSKLGNLADRLNKPAWEFLKTWIENPDAEMDAPKLPWQID